MDRLKTYRRIGEDRGNFTSECSGLQFYVFVVGVGFSYFSNGSQKERYLNSIRGKETFREGGVVQLD